MTYIMRVTLQGSKPPIWRRFQVDSKMTLGELHEVPQIAMGWTDTHLHRFTISGIQYGEPLPELDLFFEDEKSITLDQVVNQPGDTFGYEYDFGDGSEHQIKVEKIVPLSISYPECLAGIRACPPEDCGGIWGYHNFLLAISDPRHEDYDHLLEWIGGSFDPELFDLDSTNEMLQDPSDYVVAPEII